MLAEEQLAFYRDRARSLRELVPLENVLIEPTERSRSSRTTQPSSLSNGALVRVFRALRAPHNWVQLAKFCAVGASGYVINLAVYTRAAEVGGTPLPRRRGRFLLRRGVEQLLVEPPLDVPRPARATSRTRGCASSSSRSSRWSRTSSSSACSSRSAWTRCSLRRSRSSLVTPLNFVGNKLWSFAARSGPSVRRR